ncbi:MAG: WhiB family transcriptional regulator [Ornithinimicrobium sp.]
MRLSNPHLPPPITDQYSWQESGLCRRLDPEMFFLESERGPNRATKEAAAKQICARCPVVAACREHGLQAQESYGIWGGLTQSERQVHLRTQRRRRVLTTPIDGVRAEDQAS